MSYASFALAAWLAVWGSSARAQDGPLKRTAESPASSAVPAGDYLHHCSAEQQKTAADAVGLAADLLLRRTADLKAELKAMETPPGAPLPQPKMQAALKKHFAVSPAVGNHKTIMRHLVAVYEGMYYHLIDPVRWPNISCEDEQKSCRPGKYAYTLPMQGASSYLCPDFFDAKSPRLIRADTIIHEMAHRQVPTSADDFLEAGYYDYRKATPLGGADSLKNSDSYANFVVDGASKKTP